MSQFGRLPGCAPYLVKGVFQVVKTRFSRILRIHMRKILARLVRNFARAKTAFFAVFDREKSHQKCDFFAISRFSAAFRGRARENGPILGPFSLILCANFAMYVAKFAILRNLLEILADFALNRHKTAETRFCG